MREGIVREVSMDYEALRAANRAEETRRLTDAIGRDAQIGTLVAERVRLFQEGARTALDYPQDAQHIVQRLTQRVEEIQTELRARLEAVQLPADYLQPVYHCEKCHDTGYVGEPIRERCDCFQRRMRSRAYGSQGTGLDPRETFEAYDAAVYFDVPLQERPTDTQRSYMARLRDACERYAGAYPLNDRHNLLLMGQAGLGKTYLLNCIGNRVHEGGVEVLKITAYQLTERMHAAVFDRHLEGFSSLLAVPLLLLDDLGVEPLYTNITIEHLFTLLNERSLAGLHTIISTNLMLEELKQRYSERVSSRLFDRRHTSILPFMGKDVRIRLQ